MSSSSQKVFFLFADIGKSKLSWLEIVMRNLNSSELNGKKKAKHIFADINAPSTPHRQWTEKNYEKNEKWIFFFKSGKKRSNRFILSRITVNMFNAIRKGLKSFSWITNRFTKGKKRFNIQKPD